MKRIFVIILFVLMLILSGCEQEKQVYQTIYTDVFDTVITIRGYDTSEEAFNKKAEAVHDALLEYHALFDIYHNFSGGLKAVNDNAGIAPVAVDQRVMALLEDCVDFYSLSNGKMNIAMGSVLKLWHIARTDGLDHPDSAVLPDFDALTEASKHCSIENLILDKEAGTVYISDPEMSLDVGAVAKGWSAEQVSKLVPEGYLLNLGGNIRAVGGKPDGSSWAIGIQSPENPSENMCIVTLNNISAVTSGDYQRYYTVNGDRYHHIIDPETLMPSQYWRSVTILLADSGLADCLSTALFLMPIEEGLKLAQSCGAEVMWVNAEGKVYQTTGFEAYMKK